MGWLADGMEDEGGILFDLEQQEIEREIQEEIKQDRKNRVKELEGKYVVSVTGKGSGHQVFYQSQLISSGGYWTKYLSNALGFNTIEKAIRCKNKFVYGNPKIAQVINGSYKWINL